MQDIATLLQNLITQKAEIKSAVEYLNDDTVTDTFDTYPPMIQKRIVSVDDSVFEQYYTDLEDVEELDHDNVYNVYAQKQCVFDTNGEHILRIFKEQIEKEVLPPIMMSGSIYSFTSLYGVKNYCITYNSWNNSNYIKYIMIPQLSSTAITEDDLLAIKDQLVSGGYDYFSIGDNTGGDNHILVNYDLKRILELTGKRLILYKLKVTGIENFVPVSDLEYAFAFSHLIDLSNLTIDLNNINSLDSAFKYSKSLQYPPNFIGSDVNCSLYQTFYGCENIVSVELPSFYDYKNLYQTFYGCTNLVSLRIDYIMSNNFMSTFDKCTSLTTITGTIIPGKYISSGGMPNLKWSPLTNDSAMTFINSLLDGGSNQSITFSTTTFATLTEEQIAIATSKGWSVVSASA